MRVRPGTLIEIIINIALAAEVAGWQRVSLEITGTPGKRVCLRTKPIFIPKDVVQVPGSSHA